jgi:hypothetical protein
VARLPAEHTGSASHRPRGGNYPPLEHPVSLHGNTAAPPEPTPPSMSQKLHPSRVAPAVGGLHEVDDQRAAAAAAALPTAFAGRPVVIQLATE